MWTSRNSLVICVSGIGILFLATSASLSSGQDSPSKPEGGKKLEERIQQLEQRLSQTEKNLVEVLKAFKELQTQQKEKTPRWQMLNAGKKVVMLDTQTGQSHTVQPDTAQRYQTVTVGNSLFIVDTLAGVVTAERKGSK